VIWDLPYRALSHQCFTRVEVAVTPIVCRLPGVASHQLPKVFVHLPLPVTIRMMVDWWFG